MDAIPVSSRGGRSSLLRAFRAPDGDGYRVLGLESEARSSGRVVETNRRVRANPPRRIQSGLLMFAAGRWVEPESSVEGAAATSPA